MKVHNTFLINFGKPRLDFKRLVCESDRSQSTPL
jgi:hypothetical protein